MKLEDSKIFIIHYKKMVDRKNYLNNFFKNIKVSPVWIEDGQREDLTEEVIKDYYEFNPNIYNRQLSLGEIGCAIGHYQGIKEVVEKNIPYALFFEDDVIFNDTFKEDFNSKVKNIPQDFDLVSLGDCCNIGVYGEDVGGGFHRILPPRGRCGYAHILSLKACKKLLENLPFQYPIDWHIGHIVCNLDDKFTTYWMHPPLAFEGSKTGDYHSGLR